MNTGRVLVRGRHKGERKHRRQCNHRGKDWEDVRENSLEDTSLWALKLEEGSQEPRNPRSLKMVEKARK